MIPQEWMRRVCAGSIPTVLDLYTYNAVLIPTYTKKDLPGAGRGVLQGQAQMVGYFRRFMAKAGLCGTINTQIVQQLGPVKVYSGLYTFRWLDGRRPQTAEARYTYVTEMTSRGPRITTHHSSQVP